jgi:glycine betaine/proline transport system substrate-binding protein
MRRAYLLIALVAGLVLVLAACQQPDGDTGDVGETDDEVTDGEDEDGEDEDGEDEGPSGELTMARANWDTGFFQAEIYFQLLEELGYTVEHPENNEMGAEVFYQAVNKREIDFWVNGWFPLHDKFLADAPNAERVGNQVEAGAFQGYLADKATVEEHDIQTIEEIDDDPELAELFDFEGDGNADLVGCPPGWGCHESINEHFDGELGDNMNHVDAEYAVMMSDTIARFERDEPVLYYTWTPNWTVAELAPGEDVVWLESTTHPDGQDPVDGEVVPGGPDACTNDPCEIGWAANDINVVANSDFLEEEPVAKALFEEVELTVGEISEQNAKMEEGEDTSDDIQRHAETWIEENRDTVDEWLDAALSAAE